MIIFFNHLTALLKMKGLVKKKWTMWQEKNHCVTFWGELTNFTCINGQNINPVCKKRQTKHYLSRGSHNKHSNKSLVSLSFRTSWLYTSGGRRLFAAAHLVRVQEFFPPVCCDIVLSLQEAHTWVIHEKIKLNTCLFIRMVPNNIATQDL